MSAEPKVGIIEPVGGHGGMNYYDFGLCGGLARASVDVVLFTCDETCVPEEAGFQVRRVYRGIWGEGAKAKRGLAYLVGTVHSLVASVAERRKVVHLHFFHVGALALFNVMLARLLLRRVVITAHDVESFVTTLEVPFMSRAAYRLAHAVVVHNQFSRRSIVERLGVPSSKTHVIPHGNYVDSSGASPAQDYARERLGISADAKVVLFFGQIKTVKGLDVLLRAMRPTIDTVPNAVLLIAGRPWKADFETYWALMRSLAIEENCVVHLKYVPDEDVALYYAAADVVALPYRQIYQSGVLLMALSFGRPVLVSDIPGMVEVITDRETGFVFRDGDPVDMATRLVELFTEEKWLADVAPRGFDLVKREYDWNDIGRSTKEMYISLLSGRKGGPSVLQRARE